MRWVVQTNLGGRGAEQIQEACITLGYEFIPVKVVPFSDEVPDIDASQPTVFYGATRWINNVYTQNKWNPGVFFNPCSTYQTWAKSYGKYTLNYDARVLTLNELKDAIFAAEYDWDELIFIRPTSDMKEFAGEVIASKSIYEWSGKIQTDVPEFGKTEVLVSKPVGIRNEWRLFIINGRVSTGSLYRTYGKLTQAPLIPSAVKEFAEQRATEYSPAPVFVMDIGMSGGELYVIEIGCFNSAGFYDSDVTKLIKDISEQICLKQ